MARIITRAPVRGTSQVVTSTGAKLVYPQSELIREPRLLMPYMQPLGSTKLRNDKLTAANVTWYDFIGVGMRNIKTNAITTAAEGTGLTYFEKAPQGIGIQKQTAEANISIGYFNLATQATNIFTLFFVNLRRASAYAAGHFNRDDGSTRVIQNYHSNSTVGLAIFNTSGTANEVFVDTQVPYNDPIASVVISGGTPSTSFLVANGLFSVLPGSGTNRSLSTSIRVGNRDGGTTLQNGNNFMLLAGIAYIAVPLADALAWSCDPFSIFIPA